MVRMVALIAAVLASISGTPLAQQSAAPSEDLSGVYRCEGKNPDGSDYHGVVQIAAIRDTYLVHWTLSDNVEVLGVGIRRGDTLAVSYFGGTPGIVLYKNDGKRLIGEWTMGGTEGVVFTETLTPMPGVPLRPIQPRRPARPGERPAPRNEQPGSDEPIIRL